MRNRNWFLGIIFILAAIFVIATQTQSFVQIGIFSILSTILILAIVIHSLINLNFFGTFIPLVFLYKIFQQPLSLHDISLWILLVSAIFTSIGFSIVFKKYPRRTKCRHDRSEYFYKDTQSIDDNNPYAKVSFGSSSKYLHGNCLKSGQFFVSFGELEVYFDQAQLDQQEAEFFLDCSFGVMRLFVPKNWRVIDKLNISIGGIDNNTYFVNRDENAPTLILTGNVQLGNIEIKYI